MPLSLFCLQFKNLEEVVLGMKQAARKKRESAFVHIPDFRDRFAAIGVLARAVRSSGLVITSRRDSLRRCVFL